MAYAFSPKGCNEGEQIKSWLIKKILIFVETGRRKLEKGCSIKNLQTLVELLDKNWKAWLLIKNPQTLIRLVEENQNNWLIKASKPLQDNWKKTERPWLMS